jgi:hypothetical protein
VPGLAFGQRFVLHPGYTSSGEHKEEEVILRLVPSHLNGGKEPYYCYFLEKRGGKPVHMVYDIPAFQLCRTCGVACVSLIMCDFEQCTMEGQPLSVRIFGKNLNVREAQTFKEEDFPQPGPCCVLHEPSFCGVEARLSIRNAYRGATVFITGGAGYVGSVVLEQLLRLCPEISRIYLLVRYGHTYRHLGAVDYVLFAPYSL